MVRAESFTNYGRGRNSTDDAVASILKSASAPGAVNLPAFIVEDGSGLSLAIIDAETGGIKVGNSRSLSTGRGADPA